MSFSSIPEDRLVFGNEHWRSSRAIDEIEVYCDLLENLQDRRDSLETRGKDERSGSGNLDRGISGIAA